MRLLGTDEEKRVNNPVDVICACIFSPSSFHMMKSMIGSGIHRAEETERRRTEWGSEDGFLKRTDKKEIWVDTRALQCAKAAMVG